MKQIITCNQDKHEDIFICSECPHSWLFPKMRGLVIHGGAGTVSAALRSGVPSLVVPFFCDQVIHVARSLVTFSLSGRS